MSEDAHQTDEGPPDAQSLASVVRRLVNEMRPRGGAPPRIDVGDQAELRRYDGGPPSSSAYWRIVVRVLEPSGQAPGESEDRHRRWATLLQVVAKLARFHDPSASLGQALAAPGPRTSGLDEMRLLRLLRSSDDQLLENVRRLAHWIESKGARSDLLSIAYLLLTSDAEKLEKLRRRIAQDYYRAQYRATQGAKS